MTTDTMEERRRRISQIKASFPEAGQSTKYKDFTEAAPEEAAIGGFFKIKLLAAVALFAAFIFLDKNDIKLGSISAGEVVSHIEAMASVEKLAEVMENIVK